MTPTDHRKELLLNDLIKDMVSLDTTLNAAALGAFAGSFYAHTAYEDLVKLPLPALMQGFNSLWSFVQNRPPKTPKFRVFYWKADPNTPIADRLIIQIVNDDMSFLVGSLIALLTRFDLKPRRIIHPVVRVRRDLDGALLDLKGCDDQTVIDDDGIYHDESIIHCEVVDGAAPDLIALLKTELHVVLRDVRYATDDWRAMQGRIDDAIMAGSQTHDLSESDSRSELTRFLTWMKDDHFTFLGYGLYEFITPDGAIPLDPPVQNTLGILKEPTYQPLGVLFEGIRLGGEKERYIFDKSPFLINKSSKLSKVHRGVPLDTVGIKEFGDDGSLIRMHLFVGLFTSVAYDSSVRDIPLLRRKVQKILAYAGLSPHWHDGKSLIHILDTLPRDDLFQASVEELSKIALAVLTLQEQNRLALFVRRDLFDRFLSCLVYIPQHRFDSDLCDVIGGLLTTHLGGVLSHYKAQFGSLSLARVHYIVTLPSLGPLECADIPALEARLIEAARTWDDDVRAAFIARKGPYEGARLFRRFRKAFDAGYKGQFSGHDVVDDSDIIDGLNGDRPMDLRLYRTKQDLTSCLRLKLYHLGDPVPLSDILPILENLDLHVIKESPFSCTPEGGEHTLWIHDLETQTKGGYDLDLDQIQDSFCQTFAAIQGKHAENDGFNRLILRANLTAKQCQLVRAFSKYLRQLQSPFSRDYMESTLVKYPAITAGIVGFFEEKFAPKENRNHDILLTPLKDTLDRIDSVDEDRILRSFLNLALSTVRTNYYQQNDDGTPKPYLSLKLDCHQVTDMPLPRPMYEIFVYSARFEAVHLRGGKVARGGIRWSDRIEDYRTEVLGLVKAQMVKNTVIVPVGSKGGFVLKHLSDTMGRDEQITEAITCYKMMMAGLLDITDNLSGHHIVPPRNVVRYDGDDPYLVVAADKGTATFSDYANGVSADYGFWLGDAFASGGSAGYDHKKIGITARGAFESIKRHFFEMGLDPLIDPIRTIGVGDMSGDVFGNGMLLSPTIQLVGAFNHQHIFIDPTPNPAISFAERKRVFDLPRSTWRDYNPDLISSGGGVFDRKAKLIPLSPEMKSLLKVTEDHMTPSNMIRHLLSLPVDLVWFGGIGTFVKSSKESHSDAGDKANDGVRVNGRDLRCKVVAEGANLGVTQQGRIEFAASGGRINTDAVDNSAGVNCSDHEVNLKILFNTLIEKGDLDIQGRNTLLIEMTDEVSRLVLRDNEQSALALSLETLQSPKLLDGHGQLIRYLEGRGKLVRSIEYLPDDGGLADLGASMHGLSRPEIAVLSAYGKIDFYEQILASDIVSDGAFEGLLIAYFPSAIRDRYKNQIARHPLRREIIATLITNDMLNCLSGAYVYDLIIRRGILAADIVKAYFISKQIFGLDPLWQELVFKSPKTLKYPHLMTVLVDILSIIRRTLSWLLGHYDLTAETAAIINPLKAETDRFFEGIHRFLDGDTARFLEEKIAAYENMGLRADLASRLAVLQVAAMSPDIILLASQSDHSVDAVASVYFLLGARLGIADLRRRLDTLKSNTSWNRLAVSGIQDDLYTLQSRLVLDVLTWGRALNNPHRGEALLDDWLSSQANRFARLTTLLQDAFAMPSIDLAVVSVIVRELREWGS